MECSGFIQPLNLECLFVNVFSGTASIFLFASFLVISFLAAMFRMNNMVMLLIMALFGMLFSQYVGGIYLIILLIGGFVSFTAMKKLVSR